MNKIVILAGVSRSGKDTAAGFLVEGLGYAKVGSADPLKEFCQRVYGWSTEQLWGPSELRNVPDRRYPRPGRAAALARRLADRPSTPERYRLGLAHRGWLTPRHALQTLGTEWGRDLCYADTWIDLSVRRALEVAATGRGVVVTDGRFANEFDRFRAAGAEVWKVDRPGAGLKGKAARHPSECFVRSLPDAYFDVIVKNHGTLEQLESAVLYFARGGGERRAA